ncbi:DNA-processing protein DprA [Cellulomonas iranensis]|uniref:DNA-processing protein DprA n=1 Tax=Cellulomonas iranensis TaxID=76862 RepID=UPI003D7C42D8
MSEGGTTPAASRADGGAGRRARAVWSALVEPGDEVAGALVAACGAAPALHWVDTSIRRGHPDWDALEAAGGELAAPVRRRVARAVERWSARRASVDPERDLAAARRCGARLVTPDDGDWPAGLDDLGAASPHALWVRGALPARGARAGAATAADDASRVVALVGARASTSYGERVAVDLAADLVRRGWWVASGGAYGIDAAAHRGALLAGGGTVAVLAGGVDRAYPVGNARLLEEIVVSGGAVVSEVPPGAAPTRSRFLQRNRLIAALSCATVVVEAAWRSGAASTAHHAARLLRPVGAVPGAVTSAASAGCHRLLRDGVAVCVTDADEVVELAGPTRHLAPAVEDEGPAGEVDGLDPVARRVHDGLSRRAPRDVDVIAARSGVSVAEARAALGLLELDGRARRLAAGWVVVPGHESGKG